MQKHCIKPPHSTSQNINNSGVTETMTPETIWFLKKMTARSEKDFEEGKTYSHKQVKEMLKTRRNGNKEIATCL